MKDWLSKGAQPSDTVSRLLKVKNIADDRRRPASSSTTWRGGSSSTPTRCSVEEVEEDDALVIRLHVAPEDLGRVIGRGGRIARALRTLVRAGGAHGDRRVLLEIVE